MYISSIFNLLTSAITLYVYECSFDSKCMGYVRKIALYVH